MSSQFLCELEYIKDRNEKIRRSGIRDIFTPHTPISKLNALKGRTREISSLYEHLTTPGQHALLFGERGVGKSSLALTVCSEIVRDYDLRLFRKGCGKGDTFASIFREPLAHVGIDIYQSRHTNTKSLGISTCFTAKNDNSQEIIGPSILSMSPSYVAEKIQHIKGLLLIDEFDAIQNNEDKYKIAELIKLLSDYNSALKIVIVGIGDSAVDLTVGHPSLTRCLKEIKLRRLVVADLVSIIKSGQLVAKLAFTRSAMSKIAFVSSGYPYFTHLLALKAAEEAIATEKNIIDINDVVEATSKAIEDSEETLKNMYQDSIRYRNREEYERFLLAASICKEEGFSLSDIADKYFYLTKEPLNRNVTGTYIHNLVSADGKKILRRLCKGRYRFSDPRMPSFIKIAKAYMD